MLLQSFQVMYSLLYNDFSIRKKPQDLAGLGFSPFPQECANVDSFPGFLPKTPLGKKSILSQPAIFHYFFFFVCFPLVFSLSNNFSVKSATAQATSISLCMGPSFRHRIQQGFCLSALPFSDIGIYILNSYLNWLQMWLSQNPKATCEFMLTSMVLHINTTFLQGILTQWEYNSTSGSQIC